MLGLLGAYPIIWLTNKIIPLRLDPQSELLGCDIIDHGIISDPNPQNEVKFVDGKVEEMSINENFDNMQQRKRFVKEMNLSTVSERL